MTTELVDRLRDRRHCNDWYLRQEAAKEIEQLRTALWMAREDLAHIVKNMDETLHPIVAVGQPSDGDRCTGWKHRSEPIVPPEDGSTVSWIEDGDWYKIIDNPQDYIDFFPVYSAWHQPVPAGKRTAGD